MIVCDIRCANRIRSRIEKRFPTPLLVGITYLSLSMTAESARLQDDDAKRRAYVYRGSRFLRPGRQSLVEGFLRSCKILIQRGVQQMYSG